MQDKIAQLPNKLFWHINSKITAKTLLRKIC